MIQTLFPFYAGVALILISTAVSLAFYLGTEPGVSSS